jgi:hypothetical protein
MNAARRATHGEVLSAIYPRLSPRREMAVVGTVYRFEKTRRGRVDVDRMRCGALSRPIPRGGTGLHSSRSRQGCTRAPLTPVNVGGRPPAKRVALTGARSDALKLRLIYALQ